MLDALTRAPIAGAEVEVPGTLRRVHADAEGRFSVALPAGFRAVSAQAPGYLEGSSSAPT
ncbi:MAG: carboxypeptidase-like regulatory domain-containing protein [bacterium]